MTLHHDRFVLIGFCWLYGRGEFPPPPDKLRAGLVRQIQKSYAIRILHSILPFMRENLQKFDRPANCKKQQNAEVLLT